MIRFSSVALAVLLSAASLLSAQTAPSTQSQSATPPVSIRTQSSLVLLDVVVTANGTAVHGLTKDRIRVFDNNKEQQITVFEEHSPSDSPVVAKAPDLGPNIYSNIPQYTIDSAANVLLLDALNTPLSDQSYVRQQMLQYLAGIPPGTRIAVFTLSSQLRMIQGFTTSANLIASALKDKGGPQQSAILDTQFDQQLAGQAGSMASFGASQQAISNMQQFQADFASFETDLREQMTLDALQALARYLNQIPGRKNLIWFSGSFPISIDPDPTLQSTFQAARNYSDEIRRTDTMLSAARVAVYPVDARGLMTPPSTSAANSFQSGNLGSAASSGGGLIGGGRGGRSRNTHASPIGSTPNNTTGQAAAAADQKFLLQTQTEHATMQQIAEETGGQPYVDTNGIKEAVSQAIANGSHYYTIGYAPDLKRYDGSFHKLKVEVEGGYQTSYRHGFYADDPEKAAINPQRSQSLMNAALLQGAPPLSQLLFKVRVQPADTASKDAKAAATPAGSMAGSLKGPVKRYQIDYGIPAHLLDFKATPDGIHHGRFEFIVVAYNPDGKKLNFVDQNAGLDLPPALYNQILHTGMPMHQEIDLPSGPVSLRIVLRDLNTERIGALEIPITVAK